jgi:hypothetical protein
MLDWMGHVGLAFNWTQAARWATLFLALTVTSRCLWLRRKARMEALALQHENTALNQMTQLAWKASREAYEETEALRAKIRDLNDTNMSMESELRWLQTKVQDERDVFVGALRRWIQAVNNDEREALLTSRRPLLTHDVQTATHAFPIPECPPYGLLRRADALGPVDKPLTGARATEAPR